MLNRTPLVQISHKIYQLPITQFPIIDCLLSRSKKNQTFPESAEIFTNSGQKVETVVNINYMNQYEEIITGDSDFRTTSSSQTLHQENG